MINTNPIFKIDPKYHGYRSFQTSLNSIFHEIHFSPGYHHKCINKSLSPHPFMQQNTMFIHLYSIYRKLGQQLNASNQRSKTCEFVYPRCKDELNLNSLIYDNAILVRWVWNSFKTFKITCWRLLICIHFRIFSLGWQRLGIRLKFNQDWHRFCS